MPMGNLLKQYQRAGMMNVVRRRDRCERGICQKPLLASNFVKIGSSELGKGFVYLR